MSSWSLPIRSGSPALASSWFADRRWRCRRRLLWHFQGRHDIRRASNPEDFGVRNRGGSSSKPQGPRVNFPASAEPPSSASKRSKLSRRLFCKCSSPVYRAAKDLSLLSYKHRRLSALCRLLESGLRCLVRFRRVSARRYCMLLTGLMGAFVALFRGSPVTLGCSFVVIGGGSVRFSWQEIRRLFTLVNSV